MKSTSETTMKPKEYTKFKDFYPFYLSQHQHPVCQWLHFAGSLLIVLVFGYILITQTWWMVFLLPVIGYGFAWVGHFVFEKNRPATFTYPLYSLLGDWVMFWQMLKKIFIRSA
ncbi:Mpo1-like protein [Shewanella maritima]|uniref:Mpo1-like protein n=1 Tax=Shewanella maritima TaxID=2520507 RepID=UPI00373640B8